MYKKGFFITEPVGNNAFSHDKRKNKQLYVPSLVKIDKLKDIELQDDPEKIAFEDYDFSDQLSTNYGLKHFYKITHPEKEIYLFDNHNHALYFWYEAHISGKLKKNARLVHIDEHADMRDNKKIISPEIATSREKMFAFTNFVCNVGDYIVPAIHEGLVGEVVQLRSTAELEAYMEKKSINAPEETILNLDLDFFQPDLDFIDYELKKKVVQDAFSQAKVVTISTSPFFINQELALSVFRDIFSDLL